MSEQENESVCHGISDQVSRRASDNFLRLLLAQFFTKLGDALSSSKIVLPWFMSTLGVPTVLTGMLVPIREAGALVPQLFIGGLVKRYEKRKHLFVIGCVIQALAVGGMAVTAFLFRGLIAGLIIISLLIVFSLARSLCSVVSKDILGKVIPKTRRGRLGGTSASAAGVVTVALGVLLFFGLLTKNHSVVFLLVAASVCWLIAASVFHCVVEYAGEKESKQNTAQAALNSLTLLRSDSVFRRFVLSRCLLLSSTLAAPYIVMLVQQQDETNRFSDLGFFIAASGLASLFSGKLWGSFADTSSRKVMIVTAIITSVLCAAASAFALIDSVASTFYVLLFFLLALTHQGVRLGRKTYVVDIAEGNERTDYVTVSNTIVGLLLLLVGLFGAIAAQVSIGLVLAFFAIASALAAIFSVTLPEA